MIKSMTAFAGAEHLENGITTTIEIRGYNSRYLDLAVRLPGCYASLEDFIRQKVSRKIFRGRMEIRVFIKEPGAETRSFIINKPLADAYYNALDELRHHLDIKEPVSLSHLVNTSGIIESTEKEKNMEAVTACLKKTLDDALESFEDMRAKEGRAMAEDLAGRLDYISNTIEHIESLSQGLLEYYQQRLKGRIRELTREATEIDPSRIAQEAALMADKSDISEELTRAKSHVDQFKQIMESSEPGGKPLNFLLQEFTREFNTMGVKAASADISHAVVSAKTELEKLREQVQNIE
ncbi:MAG: YicC family protein [Desulfobacteraceae bacterium]|nr:YicC family protein [Desulfobacteraceae bacterium]